MIVDKHAKKESNNQHKFKSMLHLSLKNICITLLCSFPCDTHAFRISPQNAREHKASPNVRNQISNAWEVETSSRGQGAVLSRRAIVSSAMLAIVGNQLSISPVLAANDGCLADCLRECYAIAPKVIMSSSKSFLIVRLIYKRRILLSSNQLEVCIVSLMHS